MNLKQKVFHASAWVLLGYALSQLIRVGSGFIISRLLSPEIFGLLAIVYVIMVAIGLMTDLGLTLSVTKSQDTEKPEFINTIWSIQVIKGITIFLLTLCVAAFFYLANINQLFPVGIAYSNVLLPSIICVLSINALISAFDPTWILLATKNMQQALITKIELISQILCASVSIAWAWFDKSPWAIVIGMLIGTFSKSILTHFYNISPNNKWHLDKKYLFETLHFGKWIFITTLIGFYATNGDRLILGWYVDEKTLGLYSIAYMFYSLVFIVHEKLLASVVFPALSHSYESGIERLNANYHKFKLYSDAGLLFLAGAFFAASQLIISMIYDDRYLFAGNVLQVLCIAFVAMRYRITEQYFLVINKPYISSVVNSVKAVALIVLVSSLYKLYGFNGAVWGITGSAFASIPILLFLKYKYKILNARNELITIPFLALGWLVGKLSVVSVNYIIKILTS